MQGRRFVAPLLFEGGNIIDNTFHTEKLYSPVFVRILDHDEEHDHYTDDPTYPISQSDAAGYIEQIQAALYRESRALDRVRGLMEYYRDGTPVSNAVNAKVQSLFIDVEIHEDKLWAVATLEQSDELTKNELADLKDYLSGQYSDGFGEGFEQRGIKVEHQELFVSLWESGDEFFIDTEQEFAERMGIGPVPEVAVPSLAEKSTPPYTFKVCISNPNRPYDGGFSLPLPTTEEVFAPFLENLRIKDIHNVRINEVYSTHEDDNNLSFWLDRALCVPESLHSLVSLNHLGAKISGMNAEERDTFAAAVQAGWDCDTVEDMIRLADNLGNYYLEPAAINAKVYGDFSNSIDQENTCTAFERLQQSSDLEENELAKYIERLEKCVDLVAYGKLTAEQEGGVFTDYGYLQRLGDAKECSREAQEAPLIESTAAPEKPAVKVKVRPSLMETLRLGREKSREQFGDPTPGQSKDKGGEVL